MGTAPVMIVDDTAAEPVVPQREQQLADMIEDGDENAVGDIILEGYQIGKMDKHQEGR